MGSLSDFVSSAANRQTITASGTLANGDVVALNNDGTVSVVTGVSEETGTAVVFESAESLPISVASIGNDKVVIGYYDAGNSNYGTAVVGTASGTSISFGTPVVFESASTSWISVASIGNDKVVIAYQDVGNSNYGTAIVGTASGTTISFGTPVVFESADSQYIRVDSIGNDKVVIGYRDVGNSNYGTAIVGTASGTSISFGTPAVFESANVEHPFVASIGNDKVVAAYQDRGNSDYGTAVVGTVSGTSISFGTPVVFESASSAEISLASIDNDKVVIGYYDTGNSGRGTAVVGVASGTSISFGTPVLFESGTSQFISVASIGTDKVVIGYRDNDNSYYGTVVEGTASGTSISFGTPVVFESAFTNYISVASVGNGKVVIGYQDAGNSNYGTAIIRQIETLINGDDWIGISESSVTDASATIATLGAVVSNQTGLTIDADYYLATDGSLTTSSNTRKIGRALSATKLLITEGGV